MLTGFYVIQREKGEEDIRYWQRKSKLHEYDWMFRQKECRIPNCTYCTDPTTPGSCLIFTYAKHSCAKCGIEIPTWCNDIYKQQCINCYVGFNVKMDFKTTQH